MAGQKTKQTKGAIGVLCTRGSRGTQVFERWLEPHGIDVLYVEADRQAAVDEAICHPEWGLKTVSPATSQAREVMHGLVDELRSRGAGGVILGCSELPLAFTADEFAGAGLVDPVRQLAKRMLAEAGKGGNDV